MHFCAVCLHEDYFGGLLFSRKGSGEVFCRNKYIKR